MNYTTYISKSFWNSKVLIFDLFALLAIYLVPVFSHKLSLPIYYIEPMRMAIVFSIIFASFQNSILIAITLPLFSFLVSAHPVLAKSWLIASELAINVFLFYWLVGYIRNSTIAFVISLVISKVFYYAVKYLLLSSAILSGSLISTPFTVQIIMMAIFIILFYFIADRKLNRKFN